MYIFNLTIEYNFRTKWRDEECYNKISTVNPWGKEQYLNYLFTLDTKRMGFLTLLKTHHTWERELGEKKKKTRKEPSIYEERAFHLLTPRITTGGRGW